MFHASTRSTIVICARLERRSTGSVLSCEYWATGMCACLVDMKNRVVIFEWDLDSILHEYMKDSRLTGSRAWKLCVGDAIAAYWQETESEYYVLTKSADWRLIPKRSFECITSSKSTRQWGASSKDWVCDLRVDEKSHVEKKSEQRVKWKSRPTWRSTHSAQGTRRTDWPIVLLLVNERVKMYKMSLWEQHSSGSWWRSFLEMSPWIHEFKNSRQQQPVNSEVPCVSHLSLTRKAFIPCTDRFCISLTDSFCWGHDPPSEFVGQGWHLWRPHSDVSLSLSLTLSFFKLSSI